MSKLKNISELLKKFDLDGWLIYDLHDHNPVMTNLLGRQINTTRRVFLFINGQGKAVVCAHKVDSHLFTGLKNVEVVYYTSWVALTEWLEESLRPLKRVAMEYSPNGALPAMSLVDGGTIDLVRNTDTEVVSSAELFQACAAGWSDNSYKSHIRAMKLLAQIKDDAYELVGQRMQSRATCTEYDVQQFIMEEFSRYGLITDEPPVVSVNGHSGDPHYTPSRTVFSKIKAGDWVLIDLWAKETGADAIYADITWVGYVGNQVPSEQQKVFNVVKAARDAVVDSLNTHHENHTAVKGYELDRIAQKIIKDAGYGEAIIHRTGHSLSLGPTPHGLGANLDDLETHDTRTIQTGLGFTVEPGIYLPEFGVRSEINVYMAPNGPEITSPVQDEPILINA